MIFIDRTASPDLYAMNLIKKGEKMTLINALKIYTNNQLSMNKEKAFKVIAQFMSDEEANNEKMNLVERNQLFEDYRNDLENLYYKARENMM